MPIECHEAPLLASRDYLPQIVSDWALLGSLGLLRPFWGKPWLLQATMQKIGLALTDAQEAFKDSQTSMESEMVLFSCKSWSYRTSPLSDSSWFVEHTAHAHKAGKLRRIVSWSHACREPKTLALMWL